MRIIGGEYGGRVLKGTARPSTGMLREALFNCLGPRVEGSVVWDLFAGSGALGIEAMSRGAEAVTFVERDPRVLKRNLVLFPEVEAVVIRGDCMQLLGKMVGKADLIFIDPPYDMQVRDELLQIIDEKDLLATGGTLFYEEGDGSPEATDVGGLHLVKARTYGKSRLLEYERTVSRDV
jgi:16S rRNA (guanine966-N2)-methyltransferase